MKAFVNLNSLWYNAVHNLFHDSKKKSCHHIQLVKWSLEVITTRSNHHAQCHIHNHRQQCLRFVNSIFLLETFWDETSLAIIDGTISFALYLKNLLGSNKRCMEFSSARIALRQYSWSDPLMISWYLVGYGKSLASTALALARQNTNKVELISSYSKTFISWVSVFPLCALVRRLGRRNFKSPGALDSTKLGSQSSGLKKQNCF